VKPVLHVIAGGQLPEPPYPGDVLARGWRFEIDIARVKQSDTWMKARKTPDMRNHMLRIWMESWVQTPAGSLPNDDELIAAAIDMDERLFNAHRDTLMRGWYQATDGRLYHQVLTELVEKMRDGRKADRERKAAKAAGTKRPGISADFRPESGGSPPASATGTGTGPGTGSLLSTEGSLSTPSPTAYTPPDCPHLKVLQLWAEVMADQHQHEADQWRGARADHLRARWRESAMKEGGKKQRWANEQDGLIYFRRLFQWLRSSQFLMGKATPRPGVRPFKLKLEWVVQPANWAKIIEGSYHEGEN
jgi:hypothetical protein